MCPLYEYDCPEHGIFEDYRTMEYCSRPERCHVCDTISQRVISRPAIRFVSRKRLPLGYGSEGKIILGKDTGGLDIFIPSFGAMEQDEVDYVAEGAVEKEKARVKKARGKIQRQNQAMLQAYVDLAHHTKPGQRAKTIKEAMKDTARQV